MSFLILADGFVFPGKSIGALTYSVGEVVFNTSLTGYQEILTDPSYLGQLITFTTPYIGTVGINYDDYESSEVHAVGVICRSFSSYFSNWRGEESLNDFLIQKNIPILSDVDTRALTLHLREKGNQIGCLVTHDCLSFEEALACAQNHQISNNSINAAKISTSMPYIYGNNQAYQTHIVVVDCGVKNGILKALESYAVKITVVPYTSTYESLMFLKADGVLLSNGPGDPKDYEAVIALASQLLETKMPVFGICLGHQILALAAGGKTKKMKFGHHGANHPVQCCETGAVFISSQNHGFMVDEHSLPDCLSITHVSLFDGSIAGLSHKFAPAFSFQGHPEANPGPNELMPLFKKFISEVSHAQKH